MRHFLAFIGRLRFGRTFLPSLSLSLARSVLVGGPRTRDEAEQRNLRGECPLLPHRRRRRRRRRRGRRRSLIDLRFRHHRRQHPDTVTHTHTCRNAHAASDRRHANRPISAGLPVYVPSVKLPSVWVPRVSANARPLLHPRRAKAKLRKLPRIRVHVTHCVGVCVSLSLILFLFLTRFLGTLRPSPLPHPRHPLAPPPPLGRHLHTATLPKGQRSFNPRSVAVTLKGEAEGFFYRAGSRRFQNWRADSHVPFVAPLSIRVATPGAPLVAPSLARFSHQHFAIRFRQVRRNETVI